MGMARGLSDGLLRFCNGAWRDDDGDAVDIVEVVRCKDCKHCMDRKTYLRCVRFGFSHRHEVNQKDFCSYGERKDNG